MCRPSECGPLQIPCSFWKQESDCSYYYFRDTERTLIYTFIPFLLYRLFWVDIFFFSFLNSCLCCVWILSLSMDAEDHKSLSPYLSYVSGAIAGCAVTVGSYPFDLLRIILASQGEPKVCECFCDLEHCSLQGMFLWVQVMQIWPFYYYAMAMLLFSIL